MTANQRLCTSPERRLATLDTLIALRAASDGVASEVAEWLRARGSTDALERLIEDVRRTNQELIAALDEARRVLGSVGARLRRTHRRGVFRIGEEFVVPYVDEVGVDRSRRFESLAEAVAFRRGLRISRRREAMFGADDSVGRERRT
jgi:hypothetical protein